eukprot:1178822-Rhodomonas_salina.1
MWRETSRMLLSGGYTGVHTTPPSLPRTPYSFTLFLYHSFWLCSTSVSYALRQYRTIRVGQYRKAHSKGVGDRGRDLCLQPAAPRSPATLPTLHVTPRYSTLPVTLLF